MGPEKKMTDYNIIFGGQTSLPNYNPSLIPSFLLKNGSSNPNYFHLKKMYYYVRHIYVHINFRKNRSVVHSYTLSATQIYAIIKMLAQHLI